tara:strand:+ start:642 stop:833 length:192 start_codon:yes stop_codon:yes gene_type:complete
METTNEELVKLLETIAIQALYVEVWRTGTPKNSRIQVDFCRWGTVGIKENAERALAIVKGESE